MFRRGKKRIAGTVQDGHQQDSSQVTYLVTCWGMCQNVGTPAGGVVVFPFKSSNLPEKGTNSKQHIHKHAVPIMGMEQLGQASPQFSTVFPTLFLASSESPPPLVLFFGGSSASPGL